MGAGQDVVQRVEAHSLDVRSREGVNQGPAASARDHPAEAHGREAVREREPLPAVAHAQARTLGQQLADVHPARQQRCLFARQRRVGDLHLLRGQRSDQMSERIAVLVQQVGARLRAFRPHELVGRALQVRVGVCLLSQDVKPDAQVGVVDLGDVLAIVDEPARHAHQGEQRDGAQEQPQPRIPPRGLIGDKAPQLLGPLAAMAADCASGGPDAAPLPGAEPSAS